MKRALILVPVALGLSACGGASDNGGSDALRAACTEAREMMSEGVAPGQAALNAAIAYGVDDLKAVVDCMIG